MKIVFVTHTFYPIVGGAEMVIYKQAKNLSLLGHDVKIFAIKPKGYKSKDYEKIDGVEVRRFSCLFNAIPYYISFLDRSLVYPSYALAFESFYG